ncbi:protein repA [Clostridioides difficile]|uniref:protein repA n=1 Tax=Clostridioides difficile TaxID=1496 RepID=UPI00235A219B|nr:protein repA [Clostridioides difficile]MDC9192410.1 protein repA [Clostridioides difficile]
MYVVVEVEKKKVALSLPVDPNDKLQKMAQKYGLTKSGLVTFLINQADDKGTIFTK